MRVDNSKIPSLVYVNVQVKISFLHILFQINAKLPALIGYTNISIHLKTVKILGARIFHLEKSDVRPQLTLNIIKYLSNAQILTAINLGKKC